MSTQLRRGVVLRDTSAGSGLLMVEGRQMPFRLEGIWRSPVAPKPDMRVWVELDPSGQILSVEAEVPRSIVSRLLACLGSRR